jgi:hypothetical protein
MSAPGYIRKSLRRKVTDADRDAVRSFARAILHGDDEHKAWLLEASERFLAGLPVPPPRDKRTLLDAGLGRAE